METKQKRVKIPLATWEKFEEYCEKNNKIPNEELDILLNRALIKAINTPKTPLYIWKS